MRNAGNVGNRPAPEYVHIRHILGDDGEIISLNDEEGLREKIVEAGYDAVHYVDFTAAGFVAIKETGLSQPLDIKAGPQRYRSPGFLSEGRPTAGANLAKQLA